MQVLFSAMLLIYEYINDDIYILLLFLQTFGGCAQKLRKEQFYGNYCKIRKLSKLFKKHANIFLRNLVLIESPKLDKKYMGRSNHICQKY